jgi:hypothetical protein
VRPLKDTTILSYAGTPARSTFFEWKRKRNNPAEDSSPQKQRGRPPLLSDAGKLVIGGWALNQLEEGKAVTLARLQTFIEVLELERVH